MDKLDWLDEMRSLLFSVAALARLGDKAAPGSFEKENALNAARGIKARIQWCIDEATTERKSHEARSGRAS